MTWQEMEQSIAAHDRQIDALLRNQATFDEKLRQVLEISANNADTAKTLLDIVQSHQKRLDRLDGGAK